MGQNEDPMGKYEYRIYIGLGKKVREQIETLILEVSKKFLEMKKTCLLGQQVRHESMIITVAIIFEFIIVKYTYYSHFFNGYNIIYANKNNMCLSTQLL